MDRYLDMCELCFRDLYRLALLTTGNPDAASSLVEQTCVKGVRTCVNMRDARDTKIELTGILFRLVNEMRIAYRPGQPGYSEKLAGLTHSDRTMLIFRHCSGLRLSEFSRAIGVSAEHISSLLGDIMRKVAGGLGVM